MSNATAKTQSLRIPSPSPKVGINDPGFEKLTSAEKLNDSSYRKLVYQTYPDEPTCACEPPGKESDVPKSPSNLLVCRSGCMGACCSSMRQSAVTSSRRDNANKDDKVAPLIPTYCVGNEGEKIGNVCNEYETRKKAVAHNGDYCCGNNRLRGGGEGGEGRGDKGMYPQPGKVSGTIVRCLEGARYRDKKDCVNERRLDGGGCVGFEYVERYPLNRNVTSEARAAYRNEKSLEGGYSGTKYRREYPGSLQADEVIPAACCCPEKELFGRAVGNRGKDALPVVDSLVKAFKETQEFVDSLGKVPGLAGLGLMDPTDSPYFGRVRTKESDHEGIKDADKSPSPQSLPNPQCTAPCNAQILRSAIGSPTGGTPFTIGVPGRGGVVREAVPSMPGPGLTYAAGKSHKKDDKPKEGDAVTAGSPVDAEASPCGEPLCKAKLRKNEDADNSVVVPDNETEDKRVSNARGVRTSRNSEKIKAARKIHAGRKFSDISAHGIDPMGRKRSSGRSLGRMLSFVYSAGDTYSGETQAHKHCIAERHRVPGNMGWLWNLNVTVGRLKPRPGWRPGAIGHHLSELLRLAKADFSRNQKRPTSKSSSRSSSSRSRSRSAPSRRKRGKFHGDRKLVKRTQSKNRAAPKDDVEPPPTLHIHRKNGTYYVTMYPIKQETMDVPKLEEPMKPLQFKIAKNKDDASIASSSTASDMEIEFSPPAAVNRYKRKSNVVHVGTQVKQHEISGAFKVDEPARVKSKKKGKKGNK